MHKLIKSFLFLLFTSTLLGCLSDADPIVEDTPAVDNLPPQVSISSPGDGQDVGNTVSISVDAYDESGIAVVEFFANGELIDVDQEEPYEFTWSPAVGTHSISVRAVDASDQGNAATDTITVTRRSVTTGLLDSYSSVSSLRSLSYISNDLSGITYVPDTNTFFLIQNSGSRIWEVDTAFNLLRTISFRGFGDAEDIVYLGNNEFAIVIEASVLYIGTISTSTTSISPDNFQHVTFDSPYGNNGYEGIAFDSNTNTFWAVKEYGPRKIVKFQRPNGSADITINPEVPFNAENLPASDLSAIHFDSRTGNLLILSHESHKVMEVTQDGTVLSQLAMPDRSQHEGLALDSSFDLLITSEPNQYRRFSQ